MCFIPGFIAEMRSTAVKSIVNPSDFAMCKISKLLKTKENPVTVEITRFSFFGAPSGIRTPDTLLKRQVLYLLS